MKKRIILGITGATGSCYAVEFLKLMTTTGVAVDAVISASGEKVLQLETGLRPAELPGVERWFGVGDFTAPMASGSCRYEAMVILPCTMGTLAAVANGLSRNLIHRAADVTLKERRRLLLAVRETPFSRVHLTNMLKADEAGALICPAMPSFYHRPESIEMLVRAFAGRVCDLIGCEVAGMPRWQGMPPLAPDL